MGACRASTPLARVLKQHKTASLRCGKNKNNLKSQQTGESLTVIVIHVKSAKKTQPEASYLLQEVSWGKQTTPMATVCACVCVCGY